MNVIQVTSNTFFALYFFYIFNISIINLITTDGSEFVTH